MSNALYRPTALRLALLGTALVTVGFAQMGGGGRMGPGGSGSVTTGMGADMPGGLGAGMGSMDFGPVVGSDGTAYVLRQTAVTAGSQQAFKNELVAINPVGGKVNWALQIDGTMISEPVLAKDGTILLTTSEPNMIAGSTTTGPALLIIAPTATSARVQARVSINGDMLSVPVMTPDGQTIYVVGTDVPTFFVRGKAAGFVKIRVGWRYSARA